MGTIIEHLRNLKQRPELMAPILFCTFGCLVQFMLLTKEFSQREVIYDSKFAFSEEIDLPYVTICSKIAFVGNVERIFREKREILGSLCQNSQIRKCLEDKTIQDKFEKILMKNFDMDKLAEYLPSGTQFIRKISFEGASAEDHLRNGNCSIVDHILFPELCHTIVCQKDKTSMKFWRGTFGLGMIKEMMYIRLATLNLSDCHFRVMVHPSEKEPLVTPQSSGVVVPSLSTGISYHKISYKRTYLHLLPHPYETNCQPVSLAKRLDDCLNDEFIRSVNTPCPIRFIAPEKYIGKHLNLSNLKNVEEGRNERLFDKCLENLPTECKTVTYDVQLYNSEMVDDKKKRELNLIIMTPLVQDTVMFASPKLAISRYLICCGSIFGSWFGFSIFNIASHLLNTTKKVIRKNKFGSTNEPNKFGRYGKKIWSKKTNIDSINYNKPPPLFLNNREVMYW